MRYWRRASSWGSFGSVGSAAPVVPTDTRGDALPRRRGRVSPAPPCSRVLGMLEHAGLILGNGDGRAYPGDAFDGHLPAGDCLLVGAPGDRRAFEGFTCRVAGMSLPARCLHPVIVSGRILEGVYVCSPELALIQLAADGLSLFGLLCLAAELCGSYRLVNGELIGGLDCLMSVRGFREFVEKAHEIRGRARSRMVSRYVTEGSASPAETVLAIILSLPWKHGGENLGVPALNQELSLNATARAIMGRDTVRPDGLFAQAGCVYEYESDEWHSDAEQNAYDELRRNAYAAMGLSCTIVRPWNLRSPAELGKIAASLRGVVGTRRPPTTASYAVARRKLLEEALVPWKPRLSDRSNSSAEMAGFLEPEDVAAYVHEIDALKREAARRGAWGRDLLERALAIGAVSVDVSDGEFTPELRQAIASLQDFASQKMD